MRKNSQKQANVMLKIPNFSPQYLTLHYYQFSKVSINQFTTKIMVFDF